MGLLIYLYQEYGMYITMYGICRLLVCYFIECEVKYL